MTAYGNTSINIGREVRNGDLTVPIVVHMPRFGYGESPWIDDRVVGGDYLGEHKELTVAFHLARELDWENAKALICGILDLADGNKVARLLDMLTVRFAEFSEFPERGRSSS